MDEKAKMESPTHSTSAAAFVEGGIQDACEDSCSICLEDFCENDPPAVTSCRHEFHLHCILEWCQRSSQCPMCWQPLSMMEPGSQELFEAVERERNARINLSRARVVFHHPRAGSFELLDFPVGSTSDDADLDERLMEQFAAAAMRRTRQSSGDAHDSEEQAASAASSATHRGSVVPIVNQTPSPSTRWSRQDLNERVAAGQPAPVLQNRSDLQSFSDTLRSRLTTVSERYRESISKSARGWSSWRKRWFSRENSGLDLGSSVAGSECNAGFAAAPRMMMERPGVRGAAPAAASRAIAAVDLISRAGHPPSR